MRTLSGVGVLDKVVAILETVERNGPCDLAGLEAHTGFSRATAHRLARALETHAFLARDDRGRFILGLRLVELAAAAGGRDLRRLARPVMEALAATSGESVQLFVRDGESRVCIEAIDRGRGLRDIVPVGARLPMEVGSGARVLRGEMSQHGWVDSVAEREPGVASVSAPVRDAVGKVVAALSVSGPIERMTRQPGRLHGGAVAAGAAEISALLSVAS